jgi:hypothetical protein
MLSVGQVQSSNTPTPLPLVETSTTGTTETVAGSIAGALAVVVAFGFVQMVRSRGQRKVVPSFQPESQTLKTGNSMLIVVSGDLILNQGGQSRVALIPVQSADPVKNDAVNPQNQVPTELEVAQAKSNPSPHLAIAHDLTRLGPNLATAQSSDAVDAQQAKPARQLRTFQYL